jgi:acyl-CoA synthetase (AMP-forming)/AMP-acid ligase II/acyl carrier protein
MQATLRDLIDTGAATAPGSPALTDVDGAVTTYAELAALIRRRAADLSMTGIGSGDRVGIVLPNGPHLAATFLSVSDIATAAPLNPALTTSEFEFYLGDLDAAALIVATGDDSPSVAAAARLDIPVIRLVADDEGPADFHFEGLSSAGSTPEIAGPAPSDIALVLHTSGTTARPKIVPLAHANLTTSAHNVATTLRLESADRCLNVMPLFHIHGLVAALLASMSAGASVMCSPGFDGVAFFRWLTAGHATWYTAVPTMHQTVLERARAGEYTPGDAALRLARSSSASLAPTIIEGLESVLGVPVIEAYGMTEAAHQMTCNPLPPGARKPGSVGPAAGPEVAVATPDGRHLDTGGVGEVVIRGANVTAGYHGLEDQSDHFHHDGWFRTGDQGYVDDDGYLFLTGRLKEIINRGGETIAPREIDEALLAVEGVRQVVAFAVPDGALGEEVAAAVVLDDAATLTEAEIQERTAAHLTLAKVPKRIVFVDEIPKGPTGKLQRIGLAERLGITSVRRDEEATADTATIDRVRRQWQSVLQLDVVGDDDPFLESGGDSVAATALVVAIEDEFDVELPLLAFYQAATIREQASLLDELLAA